MYYKVSIIIQFWVFIQYDGTSWGLRQYKYYEIFKHSNDENFSFKAASLKKKNEYI